MNPQLTQLVAYLQSTLSGKKTYLIGWLLVVDAIYFMVTGDRLLLGAATYANPVGGSDPMMQLMQGASLMTIRAAISKAVDVVPPTDKKD